MVKIDVPAVAALLGHPVAHSLSPAIFNFLAKALGREVLYQKFDVAPEELKRFVKALAPQQLFIGWNVTLPHKEKILTLCDRVSAEARAIGAANVVHFLRGESTAYNTDAFGIRQTLREHGVRLRGKQAVLYGAGGAARAVAYALGQEGAARVWVINRTPARGKALCRHFSRILPSTRFVFVEAALCVEGKVALIAQATPLGMKPGRARFDLPTAVDQKTLAFDLIYRPNLTPFLREARHRGTATVGGMDMLAWQAIATWEIWFGKVKNRQILKQKLSRALAKLW